MKKGSIVALPGFLGLPSDWQNIFPDAIVPDMPVLPFWEWADRFNDWAKSLPVPRLLAGYSMGGRLAMHALIRAPEIWSQVFIASAHTGLELQIQKEIRLANDLRWSARFLNDSWDKLMSDWNQNEALKSSPFIDRLEQDYSREYLANALNIWSLGRQKNLKPILEFINTPIVWLAGEKDLSFSQIAKSIHFKNSNSFAVVVPETGHRLLHDNPQAIRNAWPWKL